RRLFWLLVIGLMHGALLWAGDILSVYAWMGFLLILFRKKSDDSLLIWAVGLLIVPIVTYILIYVLFVALVPPDALAKFDAAQADMLNQTTQTVGHGSYWQILTGYNLKYLAGRYAGLIVQMRIPKILAMFLLGFYAYRRGFFQELPAHKLFIRRVLIYGLALGLIGNVAFAALAGN